MSAATIYVSNDNLIELIGLKDRAGDSYINDATVTVTLADVHGTAIVGESWPLAMAYEAASDGNYRATLKDTLTLTAGTKVVATIIADGGAGLQGQWTVTLTVQQRTN